MTVKHATIICILVVTTGLGLSAFVSKGRARTCGGLCDASAMICRCDMGR